MYYRYELYIGDECQEIGFLQGLDDTGLSEDVKEELIAGFYELVIPEDIFKMGRTKSFFTEEGNAYFASAIEAVIDAYEDDGLFDVECVCISLSQLPGAAAYVDDWQVLVWDN